MRGALLDLLHALAGAQPHGGKRTNNNSVSKTRGVSLTSARGGVKRGALMRKRTPLVRFFGSFLVT